MDASVMVGTIIGVIVGVGIGGLIGGLLIMLGAKLVMGSSTPFGRAFGAALAAAVVGFVVGFVLGFIIGATAPQMLGYVQPAALVIGLVITPAIYSAILRTNDGRTPSYVQSLLIYLVQLLVVIAIGALLVFVFRIPVPGLPMP